MAGRRFSTCLVALSVLGAVWPAAAQVPATPPGAETPRIAAPSPSTAPKKRIAVLKFDGGSVAGQSGGVDLGAGLAAQLTTALIDTGQFIVVERAELASVLREQEMGMQRLVAADTAAQAGRLIGAQYLVRASLTEFEQKSGGGGLRIGIGGANALGGLGIATNTGVVGIDVRLIDATSGLVVQSRHVEAKTEDQGMSADVGARGASYGADTFAKTPLGRATQQALDQAVVFIVAALKPLAWSGRVVDTAGDQIFINSGADAGMRTGEHFVVSTVAKELTDPSTGALLGVIENRLGEVEVIDVQPNYSVARMLGPFATKRCDVVRAVAP